MTQGKKSATLYDAGGGIIFIIFFGIPFGSLFDYLWNLLVLSVALPRLPGTEKPRIGKGRKAAYSLFITVLGLIIDWAYFELTWDMSLGKSTVWIPAMTQALQLIWIVLPLAMIFLVNAALSYSFLRLERRQAIALGIIMGIFTAPWVLPILPYVFGWVI